MQGVGGHLGRDGKGAVAVVGDSELGGLGRSLCEMEGERSGVEDVVVEGEKSGVEGVVVEGERSGVENVVVEGDRVCGGQEWRCERVWVGTSHVRILCHRT